MLMSVVCCGAANVIIALNADLFLSIFTTNPEVMAYGVTRLHCVLLLQFLASSYEISGSALRGLGYSMTPTILTIFGTCVLRLIWIYTVCADNTNFELLLYIYPITWVITGSAVYIAYRRISQKVYSERLKKV